MDGLKFAELFSQHLNINMYLMEDRFNILKHANGWMLNISFKKAK